MTCTLSLTFPNPFDIVLIPSICFIFSCLISYFSLYNFVFLRVWFCISCCTTLYQSQFCLTRTLCMTYPNPADWGRTVQAPTFPPVIWLLSFFWSTKLIRPLTPAPLASSRTLSILESGIPRLENMEYVWRTWRTRKRYKTWRTSSVPRLRCFGKQLRIGKRQATYRALPP